MSKEGSFDVVKLQKRLGLAPFVPETEQQYKQYMRKVENDARTTCVSFGLCSVIHCNKSDGGKDC